MSASPEIDDSARPNRLRRAGMFVLAVALGSVVVAFTAWGALFLWYSPLPFAPLRLGLAIAFVLGTVASISLMRNRWRTLAVFLAVVAGLITWFLLIPPSLDRDWAREVAVLPTATIDGDLVTIRNIRNFDYRTDTDFTPRYYDKTFDLRKLESTDIIAVYWGSPAIAHLMVSFGFGGNDFIAFSIEMRPEHGEQTSMIESFFRKYELICIAADERDVIRVRTNFRTPREDVHVYRTRMPLEIQRDFFMSYVNDIDAMSREAQWYNTLDDNCTTGVLARTRSYHGVARYNWRLLLSGYAPEYLYALAGIDTSMPFEQLRQRCLVNSRAESSGDAADFSVRIREGQPKPKPYTMTEYDAARGSDH